MSTSNQNAGKKNNSANNSITNTPSSTPVSTIASSINTQVPMQSTTPPNNAPKYGTLVPNRIFVGGISTNTTEAELLQLFSNYGAVKAAKIIQDRAGISRGYGFVTFESEEDAKRLQREADNIVLRERKLNIAPAIKKQVPFSRAFDASSPSTITPGAPTPYFIPAGGMPFYQSGMTYYSQAPPPPGDPNAQQPPVYQSQAVYPAQSGPPQTAAYPSIMYPTQPLYMPQQFPYQPIPYDYTYYPNGAPPQYMVGNQNTTQPQGHSIQHPSSPPRTPCYNPSVPYNAETMYFNMPMYNGPLETATIYQEPLDVPNGNINEESHGFFGDYSIVEESHSTTVNSIQEFSNTTTPDSIRESNTPVVSILSLDQHQERDITSLQSGRRRKSTETISLELNKQVVAVYENSYLNENFNHTCSNLQSSSNNNFNGSLPLSPDDFGGPKLSSHLRNDTFVWYNRRRNNYYSDETQSHTDSYIDENLNEDKKPYKDHTPSSPIPFSSNLPTNKYSSRSHQNSVRSSRDFHHRYHSGNNAYRMAQHYYSYPKRNYKNNNTHNTKPLNVIRDIRFMKKDESVPSNPPTVSAGSSALESVANSPKLNSFPLQNPSMSFIPPTRRGGRRGSRRGPHSASVNEIGAGDAPLPPPSADVSDSCSKLLDNLKL